jgi:MFS family permease
VESAPPDHQGLHGSFAFTSVMTGVILGSLVAVGFNSLDGERLPPADSCLGHQVSALPAQVHSCLCCCYADRHLYTWGWRVPFLLSLVGAAIGAYIRKYLKVSAHVLGWRQAVDVALAEVCTLDLPMPTCVGCPGVVPSGAPTSRGQPLAWGWPH